jgi:hypothetical protein
MDGQQSFDEGRPRMDEATPGAHHRLQRLCGAILYLDLVPSVQGLHTIDHDLALCYATFCADARDIVIPHHGCVLHRIHGDGLLAVFATVDAAVRAALVLLAHPALASAEGYGRRVHARAGIHRGQLAMEGQAFFGLAVSLAARIAAHAGLDQLVLSADAREALADSDAWSCTDLGHTCLKGVDSPVRLFGVLPADAPSRSITWSAQARRVPS